MDDQQRLAQLFEQYSPLVLRRARRLLGNTSDADEVLQDVFVRAMKREPETAGGDDLVGWFYRVTTNLCLNRIRNAKRRRELYHAHLSPRTRREQADDAASDVELTIRWLLAHAEERQARCAAYAFLDELTHDEIAHVMGISKRSVSNLLDRFKAWARHELEREVGAEATG